MKHVVFDDPDNAAAGALLADALEQMGYQTENGTWRNFMLMGAHELRNGVPERFTGTASPDTLKAMTLDMYFDYMGIRLNGPEAAEHPETRINWDFSDTGEQYVLTLRNGTLTHRSGMLADDAPLSIHLTRDILDQITLGRTSFPKALESGQIRLEGDGQLLSTLLGLQDSFKPMFNIVTP